MQLEFNLFCLLLATAAVQSASLKDEECGYIDEEVLLGQANFAVPREQQWLARIIYEKGHESKIKDNGCLGVLISKRNVLAPAHCFLQYDGRAQAYSVQLGVWNKSSNAHEVSCDTDGYCVLPAQDIPLVGIAIYPEYDPLNLKHSLAVLTLEHDARLTTTVKPVCMPPPSLANKTLVGETFMVAGLPITGELKQKSTVNIISRPFCQKEFDALISSTTVCGYLIHNHLVYTGAPLVGIQVNADKPQNFYLVGMMLDAKMFHSINRIVASFLDVRPYLDFIYRNAEFLIVKN